jgi:hypothetical protein
LRRDLFVLGAVLCAGVIASACSSSPGPHTATGTTTHTKGSNTTTPTTSVAPTTASTTTSTTGIGPCAQVTATPAQGQGAAGTIVGTVTLAPIGSGTCTMEGYPALARFSATGAAVPVTVVNGLTVNLSGPATQPPSLITLTPGQKAEFTFQYSDVPTGSETSCTSSSTLSVTTPGATSASTPVPLTMAPCNNATVDVSPVYAAGTS